MLIYGSRTSLIVGVSAAVVGTFIGLIIGLFSGYYGGTVDNLLMRITDIFLIIPIFPLAIVLAFVVGPSLWNLIILFGFLGWPGTARQVRSAILSLKEYQFIEAARALGAGDMRIIFYHLLPNVAGIVVASMIGRTTMAILGEAGLAFVGVVDPRNISWGRIISRALGSGAIIFGAWWTLLTPGLLIALLALGFSLFGHGLTIFINPQIARR
ncbi:MAG: ABC transporter permease [Candidatus Bathyarchaeia archaeon]